MFVCFFSFGKGENFSIKKCGGAKTRFLINSAPVDVKKGLAKCPSKQMSDKIATCDTGPEKLRKDPKKNDGFQFPYKIHGTGIFAYSFTTNINQSVGKYTVRLIDPIWK